MLVQLTKLAIKKCSGDRRGLLLTAESRQPQPRTSMATGQPLIL
jgi:hypothetical protein